MIKSLGHGEGGWVGAIADPHIGKALQLIHDRPERPWTLRELALSAGLGRSAFSARFTRLVGQPIHRYLIARRMDEAALMLESSDDSIARIATRVGYQTTAAPAEPLPARRIPSAAHDAGAGCRFQARCPHKIKGICETVVPPLRRLSLTHHVACHLDAPAG